MTINRSIVKFRYVKISVQRVATSLLLRQFKILELTLFKQILLIILKS